MRMPGAPRKHFCFRELFSVSMPWLRDSLLHRPEPIFETGRSYIRQPLNPDHPAPMTTPASPDTFYASIPVFRGFASLMDPALYSALPDDW